MYCKNCGNQVDDNAIICTKCGCLTDNGVAWQSQQETQAKKDEKESSTNNTLGLVAKVLMIISTVFTGLYLIPLLWMLPMTITLCKKLKNNQQIGTGFKICILLFCNTIAGILLLCMKDNK